ncbi:hypothetical protein AALP_AAs50878U000100 [Arabis alpina]|uniref:Uncharacterized protein n=1 Tax=Arabis alpina TaxID=50452 RepID=A0A087G0Y2_ARAAL|nr:hypothetical protein AALP_AAs50878U000100 [Arabis alpina]
MPNPWSIVILCIFEAGKFDKLRLLDIFCETLDPEARYLKHFSPSALSTVRVTLQGVIVLSDEFCTSSGSFHIHSCLAC